MRRMACMPSWHSSSVHCMYCLHSGTACCALAPCAGLDCCQRRRSLQCARYTASTMHLLALLLRCPCARQTGEVPEHLPCHCNAGCSLRQIEFASRSAVRRLGGLPSQQSTLLGAKGFPGCAHESCMFLQLVGAASGSNFSLVELPSTVSRSSAGCMRCRTAKLARLDKSAVHCILLVEFFSPPTPLRPCLSAPLLRRLPAPDNHGGQDKVTHHQEDGPCVHPLARGPQRRNACGHEGCVPASWVLCVGKMVAGGQGSNVEHFLWALAYAWMGARTRPLCCGRPGRAPGRLPVL